MVGGPDSRVTVAEVRSPTLTVPDTATVSRFAWAQPLFGGDLGGCGPRMTTENWETTSVIVWGEHHGDDRG
jgi:hypothetical protein